MASTVRALPTAQGMTLHQRLNTQWHERGLQVFMVIVLAHWGEHLVQAYQVYGMGWPPAKAGGILGLWYPWLIKSEVLHYGYAIVMLIGIWMFREGFTGRSRTWWTVALWIQFWHHVEHLLLFGQAMLGHNLFNRPVPTSIVQLFVPRLELHLVYNTIVFVPMMIGMYYHLIPSETERAEMRCTCAVQPSRMAA
jgi:hypothetical protein